MGGKTMPQSRIHPDGSITQLMHDILQAAQQVHDELGPCFEERVYLRALDVELHARGLAFKREEALPVLYRDRHVGKIRADFLVADVLVGLRVQESLRETDVLRMRSCLKVAGRQAGLLLNFGAGELEVERLILHSEQE